MQNIHFPDNIYYLVDKGVYLFSDYRYDLPHDFIADTISEYLQNADDDNSEMYTELRLDLVDGAIGAVKESVQYLHNPNYIDEENVITAYLLTDNDIISLTEKEVDVLDIFYIPIEGDLYVKHIQLTDYIDSDLLLHLIRE